MPLPQKVLKVKAKPKPGPLWEGPSGTGPNGGVTYSLLSRFLTCRARFKARFLDGWRTPDGFNALMEYGNLWHACEEATTDWKEALQLEGIALQQRYPMSREEVTHWTGVCRTLYAEYLEWRTTLNEPPVTPLCREKVFDIPYSLPDGTTVRLRGKMDGVDKAEGGLWVIEHKSKSELDVVETTRQLTYDLQTCLYLVALDYLRQTDPSIPVSGKIRGVHYNVVRRSQHKQGKKETRDEFHDRLRGIVRENPGQWFGRWPVKVTSDDVARFRRECLDPLLTQVVYWYKSQTGRLPNVLAPADCLHFRHPFGVTNSVDEWGATDVDRYLDTGSTVGLVRADRLFEELQ